MSRHSHFHEELAPERPRHHNDNFAIESPILPQTNPVSPEDRYASVHKPSIGTLNSLPSPTHPTFDYFFNNMTAPAVQAPGRSLSVNSTAPSSRTEGAESTGTMSGVSTVPEEYCTLPEVFSPESIPEPVHLHLTDGTRGSGGMVAPPTPTILREKLVTEDFDYRDSTKKGWYYGSPTEDGFAFSPSGKTPPVTQAEWGVGDSDKEMYVSPQRGSRWWSRGLVIGAGGAAAGLAAGAAASGEKGDLEGRGGVAGNAGAAGDSEDSGEVREIGWGHSIWGTSKRRKRLMLVILAIVVVVAAIAIGASIAMTMRNNSQDNSSASNSSGYNDSSSTGTADATGGAATREQDHPDATTVQEALPVETGDPSATSGASEGKQQSSPTTTREPSPSPSSPSSEPSTAETKPSDKDDNDNVKTVTQAPATKTVQQTVVQTQAPATTPKATTPTTTKKASTPTTTKAATKSVISCPDDAGYMYTSGSDTFKVECGVDYSGKDGTSDLYSFESTEDGFKACIDKCASTSGCEGAGYGWYGGSMWMCWGKRGLADTVTMDDWYFAVLQ